MAAGETVTHPWMANSVAAIKARMLAEIGAASIEELFAQIPAEHRLRRPLDLPPGLRAEADLRRHLTAHARSATRPARTTSTSWAPAAGSITCRPWSTRSSAATSS